MREMIAFWSIHWERSEAVHWPLQENKAVSTSKALVVFVWCCRCWAEAQEICRHLWLLPCSNSLQTVGDVPPSTTAEHWQRALLFPHLSLLLVLPLFMFNQCLNAPTNFLGKFWKQWRATECVNGGAALQSRTDSDSLFRKHKELWS